MKIRRVISTDIAGVATLENNLVRGWSVESIAQEIDRPLGLQFAVYGEYAGSVIGWCCGFRVGEEAELLRIAVVQSKRFKGTASALLAAFEKECARQKVSTIFLEVAETNVAAQRLYDKFSYNQVGRRKGYYSPPGDDALVMNKILTR